jgi:hypothetical protein
MTLKLLLERSEIITLNVSPQVEAKLFDFARQEGIHPSELVERMLKAYQPLATTPSVYTAANDPLMARLEARIAQAPTDPAAIQEAEADLKEFMHNVNAPRKETGARLPYPEVE